VLNIGAPACGVNAAVRSIIRYGLCEGHHMYAVFDGFEGLINNQVRINFFQINKKILIIILG
jgi:6-phosphofructokinase 1